MHSPFDTLYARSFGNWGNYLVHFKYQATHNPAFSIPIEVLNEGDKTFNNNKN